jgi:hypothetical protein
MIEYGLKYSSRIVGLSIFGYPILEILNMCFYKMKQ